MTEIEKALVQYDGNNEMPFCDLVYKSLKLLQSIENPKPLSLDELRKRLGLPVYHVYIGHPEACGWVIADEDYCLADDGYGKIWVAYDNKPTEAQDE